MNIKRVLAIFAATAALFAGAAAISAPANASVDVNVDADILKVKVGVRGLDIL